MTFFAGDGAFSVSIKMRCFFHKTSIGTSQHTLFRTLPKWSGMFIWLLPACLFILKPWGCLIANIEGLRQTVVVILSPTEKAPPPAAPLGGVLTWLLYSYRSYGVDVWGYSSHRLISWLVLHRPIYIHTSTYIVSTNYFTTLQHAFISVVEASCFTESLLSFFSA